MNYKERRLARYKAECKRMGAELKDEDVYRQHKREEFYDYVAMVIFFGLAAVIIFLSQDFNINFNMDDNTADVLKASLEYQTSTNCESLSEDDYVDGCLDMFNAIASGPNTIAIDGIYRHDCYNKTILEARK